jgi:hypothetical protein
VVGVASCSSVAGLRRRLNMSRPSMAWIVKNPVKIFSKPRRFAVQSTDFSSRPSRDHVTSRIFLFSLYLTSSAGRKKKEIEICRSKPSTVQTEVKRTHVDTCPRKRLRERN